MPGRASAGSSSSGMPRCSAEARKRYGSTRRATVPMLLAHRPSGLLTAYPFFAMMLWNAPAAWGDAGADTPRRTVTHTYTSSSYDRHLEEFMTTTTSAAERTARLLELTGELSPPRFWAPSKELRAFI